MSILSQLEQLKELFEDLRNCIYTEADDPYTPRGEYMISDPVISSELISNIQDSLSSLADELRSSYFEDLAEYFGEDSNLGNYVNFDDDDFQMEIIQNNPDAYDEGLATVQQDAANSMYERKSELWDGASEDVRYIFEVIYPSLF